MKSKESSLHLFGPIWLQAFLLEFHMKELFKVTFQMTILQRRIIKYPIFRMLISLGLGYSKIPQAQYLDSQNPPSQEVLECFRPNLPLQW